MFSVVVSVEISLRNPNILKAVIRNVCLVAISIMSVHTEVALSWPQGATGVHRGLPVLLNSSPRGEQWRPWATQQLWAGCLASCPSQLLFLDFTIREVYSQATRLAFQQRIMGHGTQCFNFSWFHTVFMHIVSGDGKIYYTATNVVCPLFEKEKKKKKKVVQPVSISCNVTPLPSCLPVLCPKFAYCSNCVTVK